MDISKAGTVILGDITVNRLGFGAMRITGQGVWGEPDDHDGAIAVLKRAVELGVNFIDTADAYGPEVSENLICEALYPYDGVTIATKGGMTRSGPDQWAADGRPEHLREACEASLRRLGVDQIDLYQFHRPDPSVPFENSLRELIALKDEGKIRHLGLSNVTVEQLETARGMTEIVSVQNRYNIGDAQASADVLDYCTQNNIAFIPWFPVGGGSDLSALQAVAERHNASLHQIALAWLLAKSPIMLPIPGTKSLEHLEENVAAAAIQLSDEDLAELNQ